MKSSIKLTRALLIVLACFSILTASGQLVNKKKGGDYAAGYREYQTIDSLRRYKPDAVIGSRLYYRPEEIDVWYPAELTTSGQPLPFVYFLSLFERRANSFQDNIRYEGMAKELMQHFTIGVSSTQPPLKTKSYLNAKPFSGQFPVIIYLSSYNGMSYENVPLFEELANNGYVIISISSVGRYPGNMSTRYPDVLEQARDAEFAIHFLSNKGLDTAKIGLVGYSYGGIAGALLAMRHPNISAMLSLDGSERYYYGEDAGEDKDFNDLRNSRFWNPSALKTTYFYLESDHKQDDSPADSTYQLPVGKEQNYARLIGAEHEDFSDVSMPATKPNAPYVVVKHLALDYFNQTLKANGQYFQADLKFYAAGNIIAFTPQTARPKVGQRILDGSIISAENGDPLPYVSIGIPSGNCGTVADIHGHFSFAVPDTLAGRSIRISSLGYQAQNYTMSELIAMLSVKKPIRLNIEARHLNEVTVSVGKVHSRVIGNTSQSKFLSVGLPFKELGSELGIKVSLGKKKVLLSKFNFTISYIKMDSCTFRLNIYALKDGKPAENLLTQNIVTTIGRVPGSYTIDLLPYRIFINGKVLLSLEWVNGKPITGKGAVYFSAGLLSSSYHRKTTEADWAKLKGLGAAFNLKVLKE